MADEAGVGEGFGRARLRPFVQEHNPGAVYDVCLNSCCYVHVFLNLRHSYHVVV